LLLPVVPNERSIRARFAVGSPTLVKMTDIATAQRSTSAARTSQSTGVGAQLKLLAATTPGLLQLAQLLLALLAIVLVTVTAANVRRQQALAEACGTSAADAVTNAQRLKDAAAGMDAVAVKALATRNTPLTLDAIQTSARDSVVNDLLSGKKGVSNFDERRQKLAQRLMVAATANASANARSPQMRSILTLQLGSAEYLTQIQSAQDQLASTDPKAAANAYKNAALVMDDSIIPQAERLSQLSKADFDNKLAQHDNSSTGTTSWLFGLGVSFLVLTVGVQLLLFTRTNRLMNPPLIIVCILTLVYLASTFSGVLTSSNRLVEAGTSFSRVYEARSVRSTGYVASAQESRQFLLPDQAAVLEKKFQASVETMSSSTSQLAAALEAFQTGHAQRRALAAKDSPAAAKLLTADDTFTTYLKVNQQVIDDSKAEFDQRIASSRSPLHGFGLRSWIYLALTIGLIAIGLQPRIREYR
jgi:hypothetical protein